MGKTPCFDRLGNAFGGVIRTIFWVKNQIRACRMPTKGVEVMNKSVLLLFACIVSDDSLEQSDELFFCVV